MIIQRHQAQQLTGIFLSLSHSIPNKVYPIVSPTITIMITYPLYVIINIIVAICIKEYTKI